MKPAKQLYQWDVNQYLTGINPAAQFVDYPIGDEVIRLETDGTRCRIPDEVLQTYGGKTCYERYPDGTFRAYSFTVLYAPKPPDYIYTPEERTTFEALTARVDASIEEIKRRADSGEFTPVKGVDYFTDEEKTELMESVSSGAVGEFRKVVDTATTEYNSNAAEKLTTYNANAEQHTTDYNRNAAEKLEAYNSNHTAKVAEYDANAETKTAEFDANAAALQTEVDRLRGECDTLAAENRKQENRIDALMKLNKGQTYDILPEEGETASRTAPSGAKYVSVDKVGGTSIVWNQLVDTSTALLTTRAGVTLSRNENGKLFLSGTATGETARCVVGSVNLVAGHKYLSKRVAENVPVRIDDAETGNVALNFSGNLDVKTLTKPAYNTVYTPVKVGITVNAEIDPFIIDLTLMFGAGNEPTAEQFEAMFPAESYQYNPGEIISSRTETITAGAETITTGFPVLNSAGSGYDYIDLNEGKLNRRVGKVDLGTLNWNYSTVDAIPKFSSSGISGAIKKVESYTSVGKFICTKYAVGDWITAFGTGTYNLLATNPSGIIAVGDSDYTDAAAFKEAMQGVMLYYELADEIVTDIEIPTELTDWIEVEPGGTVTFHDADESKQLAVPNAVSWVRKLNEVE